MGRRLETTIIFCQDYIGDANIKPTRNFESKGKNTVEYKLGEITKGSSVHKTNYTTKIVYYF